MKVFTSCSTIEWRATVMAIKESKDLATLPLDKLIGNLKSLAHKAKVTREQTSDNSDSQGGSDEDIDEEEAETFNLMARNFRKFFRKGNRFGRGNRFSNGAKRFGRGRKNSFGKKGGESSRQKGFCYNCEVEGHFASECTKPKENKAFVGRAWSDSEDGDEPQNDATCLMAIDCQEVQPKPSISNNYLDIIDLLKENEELLRFNKDFTKTFEKLLKENSPLRIVRRYSQTSKAYIVLNKETMRIEKSLNVTFDESLPEPKLSSLVEDDRIIEPVVQDLVRSPSLEANASEPRYPISVEEARGQPIEQVIGELNERTVSSKTKQP
ncbi:retrovirus-related pol polyprotein from transposon TNT 1-94 [Tanacetum coccineum]